jgi:hypothetical protein
MLSTPPKTASGLGNEALLFAFALNISAQLAMAIRRLVQEVEEEVVTAGPLEVGEDPLHTHLGLNLRSKLREWSGGTWPLRL